RCAPARRVWGAGSGQARTGSRDWGGLGPGPRAARPPLPATSTPPAAASREPLRPARRRAGLSRNSDEFSCHISSREPSGGVAVAVHKPLLGRPMIKKRPDHFRRRAAAQHDLRATAAVRDSGDVGRAFTRRRVGELGYRAGSMRISAACRNALLRGAAAIDVAQMGGTCPAHVTHAKGARRLRRAPLFPLAPRADAVEGERGSPAKCLPRPLHVVLMSPHCCSFRYPPANPRAGSP